MSNDFKLHIKWFNREKTEGIATLTSNGQPLLETECIEDARLLKDLLNELNDENKELKEQVGNDYNEANSLTVKIANLEEKLNYYKVKCGSCEEGLFQQDREISKLQKENKELKKGVLACLNDVFRKDLKTILFVIAVADLQKLSEEEFHAIARLQSYLLEDIVDLEKLKGDDWND